MINVTTIGNMGKDPEQKTGGLVVTTIAATSGYGENKKTIWLNIKAFGKTGELIQKHFKKGDKLAVMGELDMYEGKDKVYPGIVVEKILFEMCYNRKKDSQETPEAKEPDKEDDLPF